MEDATQTVIYPRRNVEGLFRAISALMHHATPDQVTHALAYLDFGALDVRASREERQWSAEGADALRLILLGAAVASEPPEE